MTQPDLDAVLRAMWVGVAPVARRRVDALERWLQQCDTGGDDVQLRAAAATAAHQLAGALGSYGRSGSDEAAALELLLRGAGVPDQARPYVTALRAAVAA